MDCFRRAVRATQMAKDGGHDSGREVPHASLFFYNSFNKMLNNWIFRRNM